MRRAVFVLKVHTDNRQWETELLLSVLLGCMIPNRARLKITFYFVFGASGLRVMFVLPVRATEAATLSLCTHVKCKQLNSTHDRQGRSSVHPQRPKFKLPRMYCNHQDHGSVCPTETKSQNVQLGYCFWIGKETEATTSVNCYLFCQACNFESCLWKYLQWWDQLFEQCTLPLIEPFVLYSHCIKLFARQQISVLYHHGYNGQIRNEWMSR